MAKTISCFTIIAIAANEPPKESEPVSPMKILAGGALYQKPKQAPTIDPQNTQAPQHLEYIEFEDIPKKSYFQLHMILR